LLPEARQLVKGCFKKPRGRTDFSLVPAGRSKIECSLRRKILAFGSEYLGIHLQP
jgi:hypothetical protein